ncbi:MAG TPA: response regulator [Xanthobacteraceae bacterium]|nr:response regulator [Xanthobacteraceae bacterium]
MRILVVEDDYLLSTELEAGLADAGFVVVGVARSAAEALELALSERPDLILMDIRLAGERDGVDAALDIFDRCGIRCVFASAQADRGTRARAEAATPLGWLAKPYSVEAAVVEIRRALARLFGDR